MWRYVPDDISDGVDTDTDRIGGPDYQISRHRGDQMVDLGIGTRSGPYRDPYPEMYTMIIYTERYRYMIVYVLLRTDIRTEIYYMMRYIL